MRKLRQHERLQLGSRGTAALGCRAEQNSAVICEAQLGSTWLQPCRKPERTPAALAAGIELYCKRTVRGSRRAVALCY